MKNKSKVSVIIPTYNRANLLHRAIKSVLNQTWQDLEIIVVDDGSTDNTEEDVKRFGDQRIRYIRHKKNKGSAVARNYGIKIARGEYIAFQDSDDEWLPEKIEKQMEIFKTAPSKIGVVYTGLWRIENNKKIYIPSSEISKKEGDIHNALFIKNFVTLPSAVVKKECFKTVGLFDENLPRLQDWDLWIRISKHYQFKFIDEPLVISYYTPDSISADLRALAIAHEIILKKHFSNIFEKNKKTLMLRVYSDHLRYVGDLFLCINKAQKGRKYLIKSIKAYPLNWRSYLCYALSFLGIKFRVLLALKKATIRQ